MSLVFDHPPHLAGYQPEDPHNEPDFSTTSSAPILYLPPLLSSLPVSFVAQGASGYPVMTPTRLPNIDPASLSLHRALHHFKPSSENYAETPYDEAFNWDELALPADQEREWYCVVFRSKRKAGSDASSLYEADRKAHEEAIHNGGLLLYWYGLPNQHTGMNLATCIWQSRRHAIAAIARPHHFEAMKLAANSYEVYDLERHVLRKVAGSTGVTVEPFIGGDVGW
ncbi:hypothetical protein FB45DRAFT_196451 [Roridomyces roridus]|uniref:Uncharacterized protein n=1 Tax=Roridomyces roridus TaxID=1738132 RepID=A0AAD7G0H8_9AGAR|nr:hypothetical protein FB45DRAFT_196451 [Roridomyces roridus]